MNVYDEAHNLERAIRESEEYKQYAAAKAKIATNSDLDKMLKDFQSKQLGLQAKQMMGEEAGPEMMQSIQELYGIIMKDPLAAEYLQCEMRFSLMMQDVYKILGEVVGIE
ncbi:MAG: YlbF family regulator, partial [Anaerovoracaceae bacterium]